MLPSYWDEKIDNNKKQAIREIIKENFYDGEDLLQFIYRCIESGTENECYEDLIGQLKQELPVTGPIYENVKSTDADFEISKDDLWKIFYVQQTHNGNNIPSLEEAMNIKPKEPEPEQLSFLSEPMKEDWFQKYSRYGEDEDENRYYEGEDENWLYIWRVIKGKCDMDDGSYGAFSFEEPYNGWYDFDDKYFEDGSKHAAERIAKILGRDNEVK